jgi:hypothetical protein
MVFNHQARWQKLNWTNSLARMRGRASSGSGSGWLVGMSIILLVGPLALRLKRTLAVTDSNPLFKLL